MKSARWGLLSTLLLSVLLLPSCEVARNEIGGGESSGDLISASSLVLQEEPAVAASVARRLAEAADGFRTGDTTFFIAEVSYPYDMIGPFPSRDSADSVRETLVGYWVVGGPFVTAPDFGLTKRALLRPCKNPNSTWCNKFAPPEVFDPDSVNQMALSIILVSGDTVVYTFSPDTVEAFFFTQSAIDRFVIPYYTRLFGQAWVAEFRDSLRVAIEREIQ